MSTFINIAVALAVCAWLFHLQRRRASFSVQVFTGMGLGIALGAVMHWVQFNSTSYTLARIAASAPPATLQSSQGKRPRKARRGRVCWARDYGIL